MLVLGSFEPACGREAQKKFSSIFQKIHRYIFYFIFSRALKLGLYNEMQKTKSTITLFVLTPNVWYLFFVFSLKRNSSRKGSTQK